MSIQESNLKACMRARVPAVLVGPPGIGKSAVVRSIAKSIGYSMVTLVGSQMDPTDILGLPKSEEITLPDGSKIWGTVNLAPWWQIKILTEKRVVLNLEEITNSPPPVRASMLVMLQDQEFPDGTKMPKETIIIGSMNPTSQAANGYTLDLPTSNRLSFIPWKLNSEEWVAQMLKAFGESVSPEEQEAKNLIAGFISDNPGRLLEIPTRGNRGGGTPEVYGIDKRDESEMEVYRYAWPSPRSWDKLSKALAFTNDRATQDSLAQGIVGYAAAASFRDWLSRRSSISPRAVLSNPNSVKWKSIGHDQVTVTLRAIVEMAKMPENTVAAVQVFKHIADQGLQALGGSYIQDLIRIVMATEIPGTKLADRRKLAGELAAKYKELAMGMS